MTEYTPRTTQERATPLVSSIADPVPLGLSALAFTTAVLGCSYAGFIVPSSAAGLSITVAVALFYGGIVQILAGMWEFRKDNTIAATLFSSYGGFLVAFGVLFLPSFGLLSALSHTSALHPAIGLFFLCWTIFTGVLLLGALRSNMALIAVLALLFLAFVSLTVGELAGANATAFVIGGWFAIVCALVAWYTALADMLNSANGRFRLPMGRIG